MQVHLCVLSSQSTLYERIWTGCEWFSYDFVFQTVLFACSFRLRKERGRMVKITCGDPLRWVNFKIPFLMRTSVVQLNLEFS